MDVSPVRRQIAILVSDPRAVRLLALGLTLAGLLGFFGVLDPIVTCTPPGDGGIGGCSPS